ncbi:hypothetical cyanophage protein [Synechococcus phage S-RSM4]|uniref:Hypothetical cyanophage protein n=1 Tax=Synechococcus phage S-RSM4 TaxID=555387 RepID=C7BVG4_9CAUD|nr:restriction endonuclease II [Synechococcus phage S-RSM4]CAR63393.1 hypothetical cyanophage protein [Synechococcus phage S-RSM4]
MFKSDLSQIRITRQFKTNRDLAETIAHTEHMSDKDLKRLINFNSLDRLAQLLDTDRESIYEKCKQDYEYALTVAHGTAILASRQGSKDESYVLDEINRVSSGYGIYVQSLNNQDLRPTKDGRLLNKREFAESGLDKLECLKSIDGVINGEVEGYIFAKICFGEGGHQDNVFHEAAHFADWAEQYGEEGKVYVILIDTDLTDKFDRLKFNYDSDTVWVVDHVEFQKRLGIN